MIYQPILSPDANGHVRAATRWYARKDRSLSWRFRAELDETLDRIAENPYQFPRVEGLVRQALMKRFPYAVYFELSAGIVHIVAVAHQRQLSPWNRP